MCVDDAFWITNYGLSTFIQKGKHTHTHIKFDHLDVEGAFSHSALLVLGIFSLSGCLGVERGERGG